MSKSFEEALEELKADTIAKYKENDEVNNYKNMLDGPHAVREREIHREFAQKLVELREEYDEL